MSTPTQISRSRASERLRTQRTLAAEPEEVFELWMELESLPEILEGVRRVKIIGNRRVLWDVDIAGRQLLWEAEITGLESGKCIAWETRWGTPHWGEMRFERIAPGQTRIDVDIVYQPRGLVERIGAKLGLVRRSVDADLARFVRFASHMLEGRSRRRIH